MSCLVFCPTVLLKWLWEGKVFTINILTGFLGSAPFVGTGGDDVYSNDAAGESYMYS